MIMRCFFFFFFLLMEEEGRRMIDDGEIRKNHKNHGQCRVQL